MNQKSKFALWAVPLVVLSAALVWAKWKTDNPTPTKLDLEVRARILRAQDTLLVNSGSLGLLHHLSERERERVSEHLWINANAKFPIRTVTLNPPFITWQVSSRVEFICIGKSMQNDFYQDPVGGFTYRVHPATSRYLRWWLQQHSPVNK